MVRRQVGHRVRQHASSASRPTPASSATARSARSGRSICRPTPRACAPGSRELGAAPARRRPARARQAEPPHGRGAQGPSLRQVGHRHRLLGHPRPGGRPAGLRRCSAAATATTSCSTAPSRRSRPTRWPRKVAGYRAEGYRRFQLKVGGDPGRRHRPHPRRARRCSQPGDRLVADANTGWLQHEAVRVVRAVRDVDVYIEQPCLTYEECLAVRRRTDHPFVLDENDRRPRRAPARHGRPGDGRGQPQDQQARRPDAGRGRRATCASSHGHRDDARGQLGRRHRRRPPSRTWRTARRRSSCFTAPTSTATSPSPPPKARRSG